MARVTYSGLVTDLKGSVGGSTFQRNFSGATARNRPAQRFFPSVLQSGAKNDFAAIASSWSRIALSVQQSWNDYAALHPITDRWGNVRTLTGFQLYMQSNLNLLSIGVSLLASPPAWFPPDIVPDFEITAYSNSLHLNFYPSINYPDCDLCIYASAPTTSSKLTNRKNLWLIGHFPSPNGSIFDITTWYSQTFGLNWNSFFNGASCNIVFQLMLVNRLTGVASPFHGGILSIRNAPAPDWNSFCTSFSLLSSLSGESSIFSLVSASPGLLLGSTGPGGKVYNSSNSGLSWVSPGQLFSQTQIYCLLPLGNGIVFAGTGQSGYMLKSLDSGLSWSIVALPSSFAQVRSLALAANGVIIAGTSSPGNILRSVDSGLSWSDIGRLGSSNFVYALCHLEAGILLAGVNPSGSIFRSIDNGLSWVDLGLSLGVSTVSCFAYLGNGLVLAGCLGSSYILRSVDYGLTWSVLGPFYSQANIWSFIYLGNGLVLAGTSSGGLVLRSSDYGLTWVSIGRLGASTQVLSFIRLSSTKVLAGGYNGANIFVNS